MGLSPARAVYGGNMKKVFIVVLGLAMFICGCATVQTAKQPENYQLEKKGELIVTPTVIKSKSYTVETLDDPTPPEQIKENK